MLRRLASPQFETKACSFFRYPDVHQSIHGYIELSNLDTFGSVRSLRRLKTSGTAKVIVPRISGFQRASFSRETLSHVCAMGPFMDCFFHEVGDIRRRTGLDRHPAFSCLQPLSIHARLSMGSLRLNDVIASIMSRLSLVRSLSVCDRSEYAQRIHQWFSGWMQNSGR